jgi:Fe-S cluster biogenesis protein NfuA
MELLRRLFGRFDSGTSEGGTLLPQVRSAMSDVQAYARSHGGQIHLIGVSHDGEVKIRLAGACNGCPMSGLTLKRGIEDQLRLLVPGVRRVVQVA